jgi:hypothetical protein
MTSKANESYETERNARGRYAHLPLLYQSKLSLTQCFGETEGDTQTGANNSCSFIFVRWQN